MPSVSSVITRSSMSSAEDTSVPIKLLASVGVRNSLSSSSGSICFQSGSNLSWVANSNYLSRGRAKILAGAIQMYLRKTHLYGPIQRDGLTAMGLNRQQVTVRARLNAVTLGAMTAPLVSQKSGYQSAETGLTPSESISLRMVWSRCSSCFLVRGFLSVLVNCP